MTDEEYEQLKENINSEDAIKRMQASFILKIFPTKETKYKVGEDTLGVFDEALKSVLEGELDLFEGGKWVDEHLTEQPVKEKIRRKISERD